MGTERAGVAEASLGALAAGKGCAWRQAAPAKVSSGLVNLVAGIFFCLAQQGKLVPAMDSAGGDAPGVQLYQANISSPASVCGLNLSPC